MLSLALLATAAPFPILHYIRSNSDGTLPEHVVHYRPSRREVAVYKWISKCTTAAYVTAEMGTDVRYGRRFVAGKVARDGGQAAFGDLKLDEPSASLVADVTPPGGPRIQEAHKLSSLPFLLYDFDFADFNSVLQEHRGAAAYSFALPVIWPGERGIFRDYGRLTAKLAGRERRNGRQVLRYRLTTSGATSATGTLWTDFARGHIVEAQLGLPNHQEYRDFRLKLERVEPGGKARWDTLIAGHYARCPS